jgi:hypothetical protein
VSDGQNYLLETNPVTTQQILVILRDVTDFNPEDGHGNNQFFQLLKQAEQSLSPVFDQAPGSAGIFTMVPRNAAVMVQFDDLIDASTLTERTLRVLTGVPSVIPFEGRLLVDRNHGDLADFDGDGAKEFYTTRIIVDTTISELESFDVDPPLPINGVGFPASVDVNQASVLVRIPTVLNQTVGQNKLLRNPSGHALTSSNNGNVDFASPTQDIIRAMRSGGSTAVTGDPHNGFMRDDELPRVVGSNPVFIAQQPISLNGDDEFMLPTVQFDSSTCAQTPSAGDVIVQAGIYAEVTQPPAPHQLGVVTDLRVRLLLYPSDWDQPGQNGPVEWLSSALGQAAFLSAFDPVDDAGKQGCFVQIFPTPTGFPLNPNQGLLTSSTIGVRFSEPMDPGSLTAFDSMTLTRNPVSPDNDPPLPSSDYVVGRVQQTLDLQEFTFVPDLPLAHQQFTTEDYFLALVAGDKGPTDLAGNPLAFQLPQIELRLDPQSATQNNGGRVSRFRALDEEPPVGDEDTGPLPEWFGQHLYDLPRELIRPRPVTRFLAIADRTQAVPGLMTPFTQGVQTPLSSLGSKMQTLWRYIDFGLSLTDTTDHNLDVEGMHWSPATGQIILDGFTQFEIRLSHSRWAPDEYIDPASLFPAFPNSGLRPLYVNNPLNLDTDPQKVVHPRFLGYQVAPGNLFNTTTGTKMMPFPLNRDVAPSERQYYTWRDTSILDRAGADNAGVDPRQLYVALGLTPPTNAYFNTGKIRTIGLPLLMEFRCYPDNGATGVNAFDISLAANSSSKPYFRAFSTGGTNTSGNQVIIDPDLEDTANGGFNPASQPNPGAITYGRDNSFYIGALDLVVRVSRSVSIWFPADDPLSGGLFTSPSFNPPIIEPNVSLQPVGTEISLVFRGATSITDHPEITGPHPCLENALTLDIYGDHYNDTLIPPGAQPAHNPPRENLGVTFLDNDNTWRADVTDINGSRYYQVRVTYLANQVTGLIPELSALALSWED